MKFIPAVFVLLLIPGPFAQANVFVELDQVEYNTFPSLTYDADYGVIRIDSGGFHFCTSPTEPVPEKGLRLEINDNLYALTGPVILNITDESTLAVMTTTQGNVVCVHDRVFSDRFLGSL